METAEVALIVSGASAFITLGGLFWQLMLYRLSGARLQVRLMPGYLDRHHTIYRGAGRSGLTANFDMFDGPEVSKIGVELALIKVTNVGRISVSVENISLDFGRSSSWPWKRGRRNTEGFVVQAYEGHDSTSARLDPGSTVTVMFPFWSLVKGSKHLASKRNFTVRGSATAAGRRAELSSRRLSWKLTPRSASLFTDAGEPDAELRAYRMLWHQTRDRQGRTKFGSHWHEIKTALDNGVSDDELVEIFDNAHPEGSVYISLPYDVRAAYKNADLREQLLPLVY